MGDWRMTLIDAVAKPFLVIDFIDSVNSIQSTSSNLPSSGDTAAATMPPSV